MSDWKKTLELPGFLIGGFDRVLECRCQQSKSVDDLAVEAAQSHLRANEESRMQNGGFWGSEEVGRKGGLFRHPDPALGFHLEARQRAHWEQHHRDAEVQGGLEGLFQPLG